MKTVSVIVPVYRAEAYLDACVRSIVDQTYSRLEIILVDDGSPDNCPDLCDKWAQRDSRVRVIHQKNSGVSASRNAGIHAAQGEWIVMVDSDDYIAPYAIELLVKTQKEQNSDMVIADYTTGEDREYVFAEKYSVHSEVISAEEAMLRSYENGHQALQYIAPWIKLYKKSLFEGLGYPAGKIFEDIYLTHLILWRCEKIAVIDNEISYYYRHDDSIMHKKFHIGKLDYLEAMRQRIEFFKANGASRLSEIAYAEYLHSLIWEYSRARDLIGSRDAMRDITRRFREVYRKGYASDRYPSETEKFLRAFYISPELIVLYWKIAGHLPRIKKKG